MTDEILQTLFLALPRRCIILLEDIDCAGVRRSPAPASPIASDYDTDTDASDNDPVSEKHTKTSSSASTTSSSSSSSSSSKSSSSSQPPKLHGSRPALSFSGLLNAIDGVASHEGRILIMTTNHIEHLDSALIRPGRIDMQIAFSKVCRETARKIFTEIYKDRPFSTHENQIDLSEKIESLDDMADRFADGIPEDKWSPAEVVGYLLRYKTDPKAAVDGVEEWSGQARRNSRRRARRVKAEGE